MEISPWLVMLIGMGTVFFGLVCLIFISKLMSVLVRNAEKKKSLNTGEKTPILEEAQPEETYDAGEPEVLDRGGFDAAISAAIATYMGGDVSGLRIRSIKRIGTDANEHGRLVAAIAASIATTMNKDVEGLRISSIKKI